MGSTSANRSAWSWRTPIGCATSPGWVMRPCRTLCGLPGSTRSSCCARSWLPTVRSGPTARHPRHTGSPGPPGRSAELARDGSPPKSPDSPCRDRPQPQPLACFATTPPDAQTCPRAGVGGDSTSRSTGRKSHTSRAPARCTPALATAPLATTSEAKAGPSRRGPRAGGGRSRLRSRRAQRERSAMRVGPSGAG